MARNYETDGSAHYTPPRVRVIDDVAVRESDVEVHRFLIGDTDEPTIVAGLEFSKWEQSEAGQWVRDHCIGELYWISGPSTDYYHVCYRVVARLSDQNRTFFELKFK